MASRPRTLPLVHACRIEAWCDGLGWVVFAFADKLEGATAKAKQAKLLSPARWPGLPVRHVRVIERVPADLETGTSARLVIHRIDEPTWLSLEEAWKLRVGRNDYQPVKGGTG